MLKFLVEINVKPWVQELRAVTLYSKLPCVNCIESRVRLSYLTLGEISPQFLRNISAFKIMYGEIDCILMHDESCCNIGVQLGVYMTMGITIQTCYTGIQNDRSGHRRGYNTNKELTPYLGDDYQSKSSKRICALID